MEMKIEANYDKNREPLSEKLPLSAPYTILIEITRLCNFRCYYCIHSTKDDPDGEYQRNRLSSDTIDLQLFKKLSAEIGAMAVQPKRVLLQGLGEPLVCGELPLMVEILRRDGFKGRVDIVTNGSLMTHEMADRLTAAGVSKIVVSLQGLSSEAYEENCGYKLDFDRFVEGLSYLYEHKKDTYLYIKIIDSMLKTPEDRERFFQIFGPVCDSLNIEHLIVNQAPMGDHGGRVDHRLNIHGEPVLEREICPMPFYQLQIFLDGRALMCPITAASTELLIGDAREETLDEIWNGERHYRMLRNMLLEKRNAFEACKTCESIHCISDERENIDSAYAEILERMEQTYGFTD